MKTITLGKLEIDLEELRDFIVEGKKNCYAGNGKEAILPDGSKLLTFQKGNLYYEDNYDGYYQAPGRELVKWMGDGQRIWQMAYSGGMIDLIKPDEKLAKKAFDFLKKTLLMVPRGYPFRGPIISTDSEFKYYNHIISLNGQNNLIRFKGVEIIYLLNEARPVFSQDYIGGLCIPK